MRDRSRLLSVLDFSLFEILNLGRWPQEGTSGDESVSESVQQSLPPTRICFKRVLWCQASSNIRLSRVFETATAKRRK